MLVFDRIVGDEAPDGGVTPPEAAAARLLVFKHEIGPVLGARGAAINGVRHSTGASVKIDDNVGEAGMPVALPDDQLVKVRRVLCFACCGPRGLCAVRAACPMPSFSCSA